MKKTVILNSTNLKLYRSEATPLGVVRLLKKKAKKSAICFVRDDGRKFAPPELRSSARQQK